MEDETSNISTMMGLGLLGLGSLGLGPRTSNISDKGDATNPEPDIGNSLPWNDGFGPSYTPFTFGRYTRPGMTLSWQLAQI